MQTLKHPLLLLELLHEATSGLSSAGYAAVLRPVYLVAQHVAATCVVPAVKDVVTLWHRAAAEWAENTNQLDSARASRAAAGPYSLDEADVKFFRQDVAVREAHKKRQAVRMLWLYHVAKLDRHMLLLVLQRLHADCFIFSLDKRSFCFL